jgi:PhnB protein
MAEKTLIEQLDRSIDALLARRDYAPPADPQVAALLVLAAGLCDLPRPEFKQQLKSNLEREAAMTTTSAQPVRKEFQTVTPYLIVDRLEEFLVFLRGAFGAQETLRASGSAGGMHVELRVGDSMIMVGGGPGIPAMPSSLHLYVPDADAVYQRALEGGATSLYAPMDQPYGDHEAGVEDLSGNQWFIATHKATGHAPAGFRTVTAGLRVQDAPALLDFLKRALAAEEVSVTRAPDGTLIHGEVRIGDSMVELGEAHGRWGPMTAMLLLYVDDVDVWYRRAMAAGGTSIELPADQPYGDRRAGIKDPQGNSWYFSAPIVTGAAEPTEEGGR